MFGEHYPDIPRFNFTLEPTIPAASQFSRIQPILFHGDIIEGSLEVKLPTIWTDEKQSREEAERRERSEERRVEEKE